MRSPFLALALDRVRGGALGVSSLSRLEDRSSPEDEADVAGRDEDVLLRCFGILRRGDLSVGRGEILRAPKRWIVSGSRE
jgi:hypothetical protein